VSQVGRPLQSTAWATVAALSMLAACGGKPKAPPPPPAAVELPPASVAAALYAAPTLNPDARQRPSPLVIRVYELSGKAQFDSADFVSLYERDKQALGPTLVSQEEFVLRPDELRSWNKKLAPETKFVGVVAAYREIEKAAWRTAYAIQPNAPNNLTIRFDTLAVTITPSPR